MLSYQTVDPKFKKHRELLRDVMSPNFLQQVSAPEIYTKVNNLVKLWREKSKYTAERPFDGKTDIQRAALDVITAVSFGLEDENSATKRQLDDMLSKSTAGAPIADPQEGIVRFPFLPLTAELDASLTLIESAAVGFSSPFPRWHHWFLRQFRDMKDAARVREEWTRREADKAVKAISEDGSENTMATRTAVEHMVLREAAAAKKAGRPPRFHRPRIYDELFGFIIAGHDTTSSTLAWGVQYIADDQEAQTKLRSCLQGAFPTALAEHRQPTVQEITSTSIPYLDAVLEEILRLSAVIPLISRVAMVDTTVLGHAIPKGTQIFFTFNGPSLMKPAIEVPENVRSESSRNTKSRFGQWRAEDVEQFIPERWIDVDEKGVETFNPMKGPMITLHVKLPYYDHCMADKPASLIFTSTNGVFVSSIASAMAKMPYADKLGITDGQDPYHKKDVYLIERDYRTSLQALMLEPHTWFDASLLYTNPDFEPPTEFLHKLPVEIHRPGIALQEVKVQCSRPWTYSQLSISPSGRAGKKRGTGWYFTRQEDKVNIAFDFLLTFLHAPNLEHLTIAFSQFALGAQSLIEGLAGVRNKCLRQLRLNGAALRKVELGQYLAHVKGSCDVVLESAELLDGKWADEVKELGGLSGVSITVIEPFGADFRGGLFRDMWNAEEEGNA
ncbi:hypothetical protein KAF25_010962 [Fusarium avenaceum]|uniref:Uncharacterized protein n=1 Tax=Fusarium avenaceum TaxID=40199 RepID=A0A9P7GQF2_9HYPO|nr:hypothetical protein KAF25_010962 [Fusarium avenaceum]